jgi:hypothetical protein
MSFSAPVFSAASVCAQCFSFVENHADREQEKIETELRDRSCPQGRASSPKPQYGS